MTPAHRGFSLAISTRGLVVRAVTAGLALALTWYSLAPLGWVALLLLLLGWFMLPGIVVARRVYGRQPGALLASVLVGPPWGYGLSSLVLLGLWAAGRRDTRVLLGAPAVALIVAWPAGLLRGLLEVPRLGRRDLATLFLLWLLVPLVVGRPYSLVGASLPEGRAYRAYFTADFVWARAVVAEVSKGEVPPQNMFLRGARLHYYWLAHLLPSIEYRRTSQHLTIDQILLVQGVAISLVFVGFLYLFIRHFVNSPPAAAAPCAGAILCSSFEGAEQIVELWWLGAPFGLLKSINIDAVTRWVFHGMPVDGLQRLMLYQPHHQLGYMMGLSALITLKQPGLQTARR